MKRRYQFRINDNKDHFSPSSGNNIQFLVTFICNKSITGKDYQKNFKNI